jgi:hypothetical protein
MSLTGSENGKKRVYTERIQEELIVAYLKIFCWNLLEEASVMLVGMRGGYKPKCDRHKLQLY